MTAALLPAGITVPAVLTLLVGLVAGVSWSGRRLGMHPEWRRKLVHIAMGLATLAFPWLFAAPLPVLVLAAGAIAAFVAMRSVPALRFGLGSSLYGVERASHGEVWFTVGVASVFVLSKGEPLLFCVPILVLTLADAAGALFGVRYGRTGYNTMSGRKSAEGSAMFFAVGFTVSLAPLLAWSGMGWPAVLLVSFALAAMVTLVEAVSTRGLDNVIIPVAAWYLLSEYTAMPVITLLDRSALIVALMTFVLALKSQTSLDGAGVLGAVLLAYGCRALGGWPFFAAALIFYLHHLAATVAISRTIVVRHGLGAVLPVAVTALAWLVWVEDAEPWRLLAAFCAGMAGHFAVRAHGWRCLLGARTQGAAAVAIVSAKAVLWCFAPAWFVLPPAEVALAMAVAFFGCGAVTFAFARLYRDPCGPPDGGARWTFEGILCLAVSALVWLATGR